MKMRGFTLIEIIVVIAIIGVLAAILIPSMLGYLQVAKARKFNSNAATAFRGVQLAIVDNNNCEDYVEAGAIYISKVDGSCVAVEETTGDQIDITDYVGQGFEGYFGFETDASGTGCVFAVWSDSQLSANLVKQMSAEQVKSTVISDSQSVGCHPLKAN